MAKTLTTVLRAYHFDTRTAEGKAGWNALQTELKAQGLHVFETHGGKSHHRADLAGTVELETAHLFENQWNTVDKDGKSGHRVFDWAKDYPSNLSGCPVGIARGHYLEQTDEMREVRRNTMACGYCGKQEPAAKGYTFCPHCLDSEYLTLDQLDLTRMQPVNVRTKRAPLTPAELAYLEPLYREAQLHGTTERGRARIAKERADIQKDYDKAIHKATVKRDGLTWLMDHGVNTANVIYYDHMNVWTFGWRTPLDQTAADQLRKAMDGFPFTWSIEMVGGSKVPGRVEAVAK